MSLVSRIKGVAGLAALSVALSGAFGASSSSPTEQPLQGQEAPDFDTAMLRWSQIADGAMQALGDGRHEDALQGAAEALTLAEHAFGLHHRITLSSLEFVAALHKNQGRALDALPFEAKALEAREKLFGLDDPETLAAANALGMSYYHLGQFEAAETVFRSTASAQERRVGRDHPDTLLSLANLASVYRSRRSPDAEELSRRVAGASERVLGSSHPETLVRLNNLAALLVDLGRAAEAEALFERVLGERLRILGPDAPDTLLSLNNLAALHQAQARYAEAEPLLEQAVLSSERSLGPEDARTLTARSNLGLVYQERGRLEEAEAAFRSVLEARERLLGAAHSETTEALNNLGSFYLARGHLAAAEPLLIRALAGARPLAGRNARLAISVEANVGALYNSLGRYAEAEPIFLEALRASERVLDTNDPEAIRILDNLAALYQKQGRYAEAELLLVRARESVSGRLGEAHPESLAVANNLAALYHAQGRHTEAEPLLLRVLDLAVRELGPDGGVTNGALVNLAALYQEQGRYSEAEPLYARALASLERLRGPEHPQTLAALNNLALIYELQARHEAAEALFRRAIDGSEKTLGSDHPDTLTAQANLAALYHSQQQSSEAEALYRRVLAGRERVLGIEHRDTLASLNNLAVLLKDQERFADAEPLLKRAVDAAARTYGPNHPRRSDFAANLAVVQLFNSDAAGALLAARTAVRVLDSRSLAASEDPYGDAQRAREEISDARKYTLIADAVWAAADPAEGQQASLPEAFRALQQAMAGSASRAVVQMAARRAADNEGLELGALVQEREALTAQWSARSERMSEVLAGRAGATASAVGQLASERNQLEAEIREIDARLGKSFPEYFALIRPEPLDVAAAQALLAPDEAILLVVPTGFGTHLLALSSETVEWVRSASTEREVDNAVRRLLWDVGAKVESTDAEAFQWEIAAGPGYSFDRGTAFKLYRQIVAPVAHVLQGKRHVFTAATGSLSGLPFGLLVTEEPTGSNADPDALRATSWFADAHALAQIPSIQSLQFLRRIAPAPAASADRPFAFRGFGDPLLGGAAERRSADRGRSGGAEMKAFSGRRFRYGAVVADINELRKMARLPGTAIELEQLRNALGAPPESILLRDEATEAAVRSTDLSGVGIIALATHGLLAGEITGAREPALVFTPPETVSEANDGLLTASEVSSMRLSADFVILSACNTAGGDGSIGAPGLSGLARSFFYAGARNLLASHWPVRDDVAATITVRMLQILESAPALSRAQAFQQAMREVRDDRTGDAADESWAHPSAWAPFSLIGDGAR